MKVAPEMVIQVHLKRSLDLAPNLSNAHSCLLSLQRQDPASGELYGLLCQQNQLLSQRLRSLQASPSTMNLLELQNLTALAQLHCRLAAWLAEGDSNAGPNNNLPQPSRPATAKASLPATAKAGQPATAQPAQLVSKPSPGPASKGQGGPALDFD